MQPNILKAIAIGCPNLKICEQLDTTVEGMQYLALFCKKLEQLELNSATDETLHIIANSLHGLKSIELVLGNVSASGLKLLASKCKPIVKLGLPNCTPISSQFLQYFSAHHLEYLNLKNTSSHGLHWLGSQPQLHTLHTGFCESKRLECGLLPKQFPNLQYLDWGGDVTDQGLYFIGQLHSLKHLSIAGGFCTNWKIIGEGCPQLSFLSIRNFQELTADVIESWSCLINLETLKLIVQSIDIYVFKSILMHCPKLARCSISCLYNETQNINLMLKYRPINIDLFQYIGFPPADFQHILASGDQSLQL